jgi:hypothetical protein
MELLENFVAGSWRPSVDAEALPVINPASG